MKKLFSVIAMLLAVAMMTLTATPALAAAKETLYISDVVFVSADSYRDAKIKLDEQGYQIIADELNPGLDEQVYIGYKTTDDPEEAITDMAVMNMNGPFSYSSYKKIIETQYSYVDAHMSKLVPSIVRYQENYDAGKQSAQLLREALNCYKEDLYHEPPVLMGDYLYSYDGSRAAHDELTNIFMRGGTETILSIEAMLAMASENTEDTLAERIAVVDEDEMNNYYFEKYDTASEARKGMKSELGEAAQFIYDSFSGFREYLRSIEEDYLVNADSEPSLNQEVLDECDYEPEYFKDMPEDYNDYLNACGEVMENMTREFMLSDVSVYMIFKMIPYDDGTLYDFFMQDDEDVELSDIYPIVYCMNDAQRALLGNIGFKQLLLFTFADVDNADSETVAALRGYIDAFGAIPSSVYDGIDLSVFDDGVAFTDAATRHDRLTNDCWLAEYLGGETEVDTMIRSTLIASGLALVLGTTTAIAEAVYINSANTIVAQREHLDNINRLHDELRKAQGQHAQYFFAVDDAEEKMLEYVNDPEMFAHYKEIFDEYDPIRYEWQQKHKLASNNLRAAQAKSPAILADKNPERTFTISGAVRTVSLILTIITIAYDIYSIVHLICAALPKEEPIPHHLVTTVPTKYGDSYVYYAAAKNVNGGYADINNHEDASLGWLTLYTTKDAYAGDPILAEDFSVNVGKSYIAPGMSALHMFNETAACNINDKTYSGSDNDAIYITFRRDASDYTASTFSTGMIAAVGGGALLLGAALGTLATALVRRKKKDDGEVVAES